MKLFGQTLLISCYELGHQPIGLALPAAFLEDAGYVPDVLDLSIAPLSVDQVKRASFIAISVPMHTALRIGIDAAERIRKINPNAHISFFGLYAPLNAEMLLKGVADSVVGGEYESALLTLLESLSSGNTDPIAGVSFKGRITTPYLGHLPFVTPMRAQLPPLTKYAKLIENNQERVVGYTEASRGCRHHCRHCPIPPVYGGRFFVLPRDLILEDIKNLVAMGASHITFGDPDFLNAPVHALRIARQLHRIFPEVTFDFTAKVEHLIKYQSDLPEFASLGCIFIISAVESFSDTILSHLAKNHTRTDAIAVFYLSQKAGIALRPTFLPFTPWTSLEDLRNLFETIENEGMIDYVDPIQLTIRLLIPPASLLLTESSMQPFLGLIDENEITYAWSHPDARLDALQKRFSQTVEAGLAEDCDPRTIFYQLKEYTLALIEARDPQIIKGTPEIERVLPPRLSESWFCCSEPTRCQVTSIAPK